MQLTYKNTQVDWKALFKQDVYLRLQWKQRNLTPSDDQLDLHKLTLNDPACLETIVELHAIVPDESYTICNTMEFSPTSNGEWTCLFTCKSDIHPHEHWISIHHMQDYRVLQSFPLNVLDTVELSDAYNYQDGYFVCGLKSLETHWYAFEGLVVVRFNLPKDQVPFRKDDQWSHLAFHQEPSADWTIIKFSTLSPHIPYLLDPRCRCIGDTLHVYGIHGHSRRPMRLIFSNPSPTCPQFKLESIHYYGNERVRQVYLQRHRMDLLFTINAAHSIQVWLVEGRSPNVPICTLVGCKARPLSLIWETIALERSSGGDASHERAHQAIHVTSTTRHSVYSWTIPPIPYLLASTTITHIIDGNALGFETFNYGLMTVYRGLLYQINSQCCLQVVDISGWNHSKEAECIAQFYNDTWEFSAVFNQELFILGDQVVTRQLLK